MLEQARECCWPDERNGVELGKVVKRIVVCRLANAVRAVEQVGVRNSVADCRALHDPLRIALISYITK